MDPLIAVVIRGIETQFAKSLLQGVLNFQGPGAVGLWKMYQCFHIKQRVEHSRLGASAEFTISTWKDLKLMMIDEYYPMRRVEVEELAGEHLFLVEEKPFRTLTWLRVTRLTSVETNNPIELEDRNKSYQNETFERRMQVGTFQQRMGWICLDGYERLCAIGNESINRLSFSWIANREWTMCWDDDSLIATSSIDVEATDPYVQPHALYLQQTPLSNPITKMEDEYELRRDNDLLKSTLSGNEKSIAFLYSEKEIFEFALADDLRSACDREHTKVLELEAEVFKQQKMVIESEKRNSHLQKNHIDLQLKFQNYKQCIDTSSASNAIFEINKLRKQLQGKDDTIRNLETQINITRMLNVGSTEGSCDQQALETDRIQLKDTITSLRIQLDGLKVENVSLKRRYDELSKANTHSRTAYTEKLSAFTAENTKLKAQVTGKTSSGPSTSETPKVLASGIYNVGSKYIPPPKRANWVKPSPLPKKKQVTFQEPSRPSTRPTQKPPVQQNKKHNVSVNLSTRTKPATEPRKPMPKSHTRNHRFLPSKSVNERRAADHNRKLNFVDHNQFVIRSLKSVYPKTPKAKHNMKTTKKVWKAKVVASVKPQWKPTG
ncbi:hypothetical protein Tco_0905619 [Tanacetum coccineum]